LFLLCHIYTIFHVEAHDIRDNIIYSLSYLQNKHIEHPQKLFLQPLHCNPLLQVASKDSKNLEKCMSTLNEAGGKPAGG
jgi:hypothetical protein